MVPVALSFQILQLIVALVKAQVGLGEDASGSSLIHLEVLLRIKMAWVAGIPRPWIFQLRPLELYIYWNIEEGLAGEGLARDGLAGEEADKVEAQEVPAKAGAVCSDI